MIIRAVVMIQIVVLVTDFEMTFTCDLFKLIIFTWKIVTMNFCPDHNFQITTAI